MTKDFELTIQDCQIEAMTAAKFRELCRDKNHDWVTAERLTAARLLKIHVALEQRERLAGIVDRSGIHLHVNTYAVERRCDGWVVMQRAIGRGDGYIDPGWEDVRPTITYGDVFAALAAADKLEAAPASDEGDG